MPKTRWSKSEAFAHFGAKCVNDRWGWSGVSEDETIVVLTLWTDLLRPQRPGYSYSDFELRDIEWQKTAGNSARRRHIAHALDALDGRFRPIYAQAVDPLASPRSIKSCAPKDVWWRITRFDRRSGEFEAHMFS